MKRKRLKSGQKDGAQNFASILDHEPGTLLWTRTLGTIISYFRKPTKASREQELHGHARKLCVTLLSIAYDNELRYHFTDEGLSISRNVCYQLSRFSVKPFP